MKNKEKIIIDGVQSFSDNETYNYQTSASKSDLGYNNYSDRQRTISIVIWRKNNAFCNKIETEILSNKIFQFFNGDNIIII